MRSIWLSIAGPALGSAAGKCCLALSRFWGLLRLLDRSRLSIWPVRGSWPASSRCFANIWAASAAKIAGARPLASALALDARFGLGTALPMAAGAVAADLRLRRPRGRGSVALGARLALHMVRGLRRAP